MFIIVSSRDLSIHRVAVSHYSNRNYNVIVLFSLSRGVPPLASGAACEAGPFCPLLIQLIYLFVSSCVKLTDVYHSSACIHVAKSSFCSCREGDQ